MAGSISSWASGIVLAVILATIFEMIIPEGNNKKYVKVVIGIYILFTIISPVIGNKLDFKELLDYESYFNIDDTYQTMSDSLEIDNSSNINEIYISGLKEDIKNRLIEKGYILTNINLDVELKDEKKYGTIKKIDIKVNKKSVDDVSNTTNTVNQIQKININIGSNTESANTEDKKSNITILEINELKIYLSNIYEINKSNININ